MSLVTGAVTSGTHWWIWVVVLAPLLGAAGFVWWRWATPPTKPKLSDEVGPATWDFSQSFATNLTVLGSVLGTILTAGVLPDTSSAPPGLYAGLNLLFGVLVLLGPFIYTAMQKAEPVHQDSSVAEPQFQGSVLWFLVATAVTLWAAIGELITIGLVFNEIRAGQSMPAVILWVMIVVLAAGVAFLVILAQRRIDAVLAQQVIDASNLAARQTAVRQRLLASGLPDVPAQADIRPTVRGWTVM